LIDVEFGECEGAPQAKEPPPFNVDGWEGQKREYNPDEIWNTEEVDEIPF